MRESARLIWDDPMLFLHKFGETAFHAIVVWCLVAPLWITLIYFTSRTTLREIARVRAEAAAKLAASKLSDPTNHPVP
jgi:hypothetical protein